MGHQQVFDFLWVDIDPARNDHEALAVGQEYVAFLIFVTHVAQAGPPVFVAGVLGLVRIVVIFKRDHPFGRFEEDLPFGAARHFITVFVADPDNPSQGAANRAGALEPLGAGYEGEAVAFGPGVIFVEHRAPPFDHRFLDRHRAGRGGVDCAFEAGDIVLPAHILGQFEHPDKVRRHELAVGDLVFLDRGQRHFGIELLHHHHGPAQLLDGHTPAQRRGVIERSGGQIDRIGLDPESHHGQPD